MKVLGSVYIFCPVRNIKLLFYARKRKESPNADLKEMAQVPTLVYNTTGCRFGGSYIIFMSVYYEINVPYATHKNVN